MFQEIGGGHRLEIKHIHCENCLKLSRDETFSVGPLEVGPLEKALRKICLLFHIYSHTPNTVKASSQYDASPTFRFVPLPIVTYRHVNL